MGRYDFYDLIEKGHSRNEAEKILHDQEIEDAYAAGKRAILEPLLIYTYGLTAVAAVIAAFVPQLDAASILTMGVLCSTLIGVFRFSIRE